MFPRYSALKRHSSSYARFYVETRTSPRPPPRPAPARSGPAVRHLLPNFSRAQYRFFCGRYRIFPSRERTNDSHELAGENNDCFAIMRLQFKIVSTRSGPAPSLSPFAPVTDWMRPSTPLKTLRRDALSSNTSARRHYSGLQGCNPTEVGHGHGHIHEPH